MGEAMAALALEARLALLEERECEEPEAEDRRVIGGAPVPLLEVWARVWTWERAVAWRKVAGEVDGEEVMTGDDFNMVCGASSRP